jgi:ketosteroid isomerase-like protein
MTATSDLRTDPKIAMVQNIYDAFFRQDIDAAIADLAEDVDWAAEAASDSVPWYGTFHGKAQVPNFFAAIGSNVDVSEFEVRTIAANDADVIAVVHWTYTVRATGKTASMYMQHWFRFSDGKITFFRGSEDSEQSAYAFS